MPDRAAIQAVPRAWRRSGRPARQSSFAGAYAGAAHRGRGAAARLEGLRSARRSCLNKVRREMPETTGQSYPDASTLLGEAYFRSHQYPSRATASSNGDRRDTRERRFAAITSPGALGRLVDIALRIEELNELDELFRVDDCDIRPRRQVRLARVRAGRRACSRRRTSRGAKARRSAQRRPQERYTLHQAQYLARRSIADERSAAAG